MVVVVVAGGKWEVSNCKSVSPVFPRTESPPQKETRSEAAETRLWLSIEDSSKTSLPAPTFHRLRPPAPPHTLRFSPCVRTLGPALCLGCRMGCIFLERDRWKLSLLVHSFGVTSLSPHLSG